MEQNGDRQDGSPPSRLPGESRLSTGGRLFDALGPFPRGGLGVCGNVAAPARRVRRLTTAPAAAEHLDIAAENSREVEKSVMSDSAYQGITGCVFFTQHLAEIGQTGL
jgi:hypothetical protein